MKHTKNFDDFVKSKNKYQDRNAVDWKKRKEYWLSSISKLYTIIKSRWLNDYIKQNQIVVNEEDISLQEDFFGQYQTKKLIVTIGKDMLILKPVGGIISGAYGRIDVSGRRGTINLILNESSQWEYKMKTPFIEFIELNKQTFLEIVEELMQ